MYTISVTIQPKRKTNHTMRKRTLIYIFVGTVLPLLFNAPAAAQATRTWVSGVGDDANPCSRTAPCKTFAGAISKTAAGGEIDTLDPGGFGALTITKAITIASEGVGAAGVLVSGTDGFVVAAGPSDVVVLRGLDFEGLGTAAGSLDGIKFNSGGALVVQDCTIRDFNSSSAGHGIAFTPSGASSLFVSDTTVSNNGTGTTGGGILIQPTGSGSAKASIIRVNSTGNVLGIRADGTGSTGGITVSISDSTAANNVFAGMTAFTPVGGASVKMEILHSASSNNGTGLNSNGGLATLRVGYSLVTGNGTGVNVANLATMTSLGNNMIFDNAVSGPVIPITGGQ
jgi:hypothetical protein